MKLRKKLIKLPIDEAEESMCIEQIDMLSKTVNTSVLGLLLIGVALISIIFFRYDFTERIVAISIVTLATLFSIVFIKSYERLQSVILFNLSTIKEEKIKKEQTTEEEENETSNKQETGGEQIKEPSEEGNDEQNT